MKKSLLLIFMGVLVFMFSGCVFIISPYNLTVYNNTEYGNGDLTLMQLYIDGEYKDDLYTGRSKTYSLPFGNHDIMIKLKSTLSHVNEDRIFYLSYYLNDNSKIYTSNDIIPDKAYKVRISNNSVYSNDGNRSTLVAVFMNNLKIGKIKTYEYVDTYADRGLNGIKLEFQPVTNHWSESRAYFVSKNIDADVSYNTYDIAISQNQIKQLETRSAQENYDDLGAARDVINYTITSTPPEEKLVASEIE